MSAAYNLSWNTDINYKCLRPNNKYSLKVLWVKYQISSAYVKCQINDFKCDSTIRGQTIKFANSPPCSCRGSTGQKP